MKCERPGCEQRLSEDQVRRGVHFHSEQCTNLVNAEKRRVHFPPLAQVEVDYRMKCYSCDGWYDGRRGVDLFFCSDACRDKWEPTMRLARRAEVEQWRNARPRLTAIRSA